MISAKSREAVESLRRLPEFQVFVEYLIREREARRHDLESSVIALQAHKLQGYCLALSDLITLCSPEHR
jgi:hypothetical protein